jgi:hypothetical protein
MSGFKANSAALKIQFALKLNNCIKNLEKFQNIKLNTLSSTLSFDEFRKIIIKKDILDTTKHFCETLESFKSGLKINPRVLITAYLIKNYPLELVGSDSDRHPIDNYICNLSDIVVQQLESNKINEIWTALRDFKIAFVDWSSMDKDRTIEKLVVSYYYRSEHIDKIKSGELFQKQELVDINQQDQMTLIVELERQRKEIIQSIKLINKNFDTVYLQENYVEIYNQIQTTWAKLQASITNTMKKAYYDMLSTDISNGSLLSCFALLKEIGQRLGVLCPQKNKASFALKFSDDILTGLLAEPEYTHDLIKFIGFVIDFIIQMDAPVNDDSNTQWKVQVAELMKVDFSKSFPQILIQIEEHIDQIYQMIYDLNQNKN